jgi:hypothetical protein
MGIATLNLANWASIAQIALALTALLALVVAAIQIVTARSVGRQTLTYNYTHRFSSPELLRYHEKTGELFAPSEDRAEERYRKFLALGRADQLAALVIPNLLEELAGMYNHGLLDKRIAKDFFGETARDIWVGGSWLVERWAENRSEVLRAVGADARGHEAASPEHRARQLTATRPRARA